MSGTEGWDLWASTGRERWYWGSLIWAQTGTRHWVEGDFLPYPLITSSPLPKRTQKPLQLKPNPMMCFTCFDVTSCWLVLCCSITAQEKQKIGSWVLKEKSRPFPKCFFSCRFFFLVLSIYFCFFLQCVERSEFLHESFVYEENFFPLACVVLSTKEKLDERKAFFLLNRCVLFSSGQIPFSPLLNEYL